MTTRALLLGVSIVSMGALVSETALAQAAAQAGDVQPQKPKPAKKKRAAAKPAVVPAQVASARAQIGRPGQSLDEITVTASKTEERAIDALAPVSVVTLEQIQGRQASTVGDLIYNVPGVWLQNRGDEPSTSINIRGLQDFGRVAVVVDGARQNYQRTGHFANGSFFLNPELIGGIDIVRGPTANIYGSGAIGGVASFRTKDIQDVLRPGETWGVDVNSVIGSNAGRALGSAFGGVRINPNIDFFAGGTYSTQENYRDGTGYEVANTGNRLSSGIAKLTVRPADGHEIKLGTVFQENLYSVGQPARLAGSPNSTNPNGTNNLGGTSIYATNVKNYTTTLGWKYSQPDDKLFDWDAKIYWNRTENDQVKTGHTSTTAFDGCRTPGNAISGCIGDPRGYTIDTYGFDVFNTSRVDIGDWHHAFTYGADGFRDEVSGFDKSGNSNVTTPSGTRSVFGGFGQWKVNYKSLVEVISGIRYDNYELSSPAGGTSGDRFSPKVTIGFLPGSIATPYFSYAEGYRAPSITETLVTGRHVAAGGGGAFAVCPDGLGFFCFLPNSKLRAETGKTMEAGLNLKKDGIFTGTDSFRGKLNVYQNNVEDYIDLVGPITTATNPTVCPAPMGTCYQYQNLAGGARIQGFEMETMYDANSWFVGVSGSVQSGKNNATGVGLYSIPSQKVTTTAGVRLLDNSITMSVMWTNVQGNKDIPASYLPATSYDLVNLYIMAKPTKDVTLNFSVENLLNQYYRPYAVPSSADFTSTQNDVKWASAGAGIVFKGGLKYHFGG
jgi:hemoglobin/transferrin/lactoferrin receptor protein